MNPFLNTLASFPNLCASKHRAVIFLYLLHPVTCASSDVPSDDWAYRVQTPAVRSPICPCKGQWQLQAFLVRDLTKPQNGGCGWAFMSDPPKQSSREGQKQGVYGELFSEASSDEAGGAGGGVGRKLARLQSPQQIHSTTSQTLCCGAHITGAVMAQM